MNKNFDKIAFNVTFDTALVELQGAEKITKKILANLSRLVLEQVHFDGDIQPVNRLIDVLTPMNRKTSILFFQHFSGHQFNEKELKFSKRDKQHYAHKLELADEFLADETNNIWTWVKDEGLEVKAGKVFKLENVTKYVHDAIEKATENNLSQSDVIVAILAGGIELNTIMEVLKFQAEQAELKQAA